MADISAVLADLHDESEELDTVVANMAGDAWTRTTPAPGWTIAHQIGHLAWTDDLALLAATDADGFQAALVGFATGGGAAVDRAAAELAEQPVAELLARWRAGRARLASALTAAPAAARIGWFGPPMSPTSMATARLMETWAHGQDVLDCLGLRRAATPRLRHICHLGVRTRDFAFAVRGMAPPQEPFRVELSGPAGVRWSWGPVEAQQRVAGAALDFCMLVTQRRNRADLAVVAWGPDAEVWLDIAQAFAGPPGQGRAAGVIAGVRADLDGAR